MFSPLHETLDESKRPDFSAPALDPMFESINTFATLNHLANYHSGWWTHPTNGAAKDRNVPEMLMLIVSEIAEGMEGFRKDLKDDHLPQHSMLAVELADAVIRIGDLAGALGIPLGTIIREKMVYNARRADHKLSARQASNGKAF